MQRSSERRVGVVLRAVLCSAWFVLATGCGGTDGGSRSANATASPSGGGSAVLDTDGQPLGTVRFPNSCTTAAQEHLERGLALLHHMTYGRAEDAFRAAAAADPECALAYWGTAMTDVHPLWPDTISAPHLAEGRALLGRAREAAHADARERSYVEALAAYYEGDGKRTERDRLAGFLDGWANVHRDHPDDPEAALFHALALLATAPPGDASLVRQRAAGAIAEEVRARLPRHPGAHHYIIHAYDAPPLAADALPAARSYGDLAPENSHALHMTSHIFTRLGLWPESIQFNRRAAAAAQERTAAGAVSLHRLHALDYLAYAYLQIADLAAARGVRAQMEALAPPYQDHAAVAYAFAAVPARIALERRAWKEAAEVPVRWPEQVAWDAYPHLVAIPVFARALAAARTGDRRAAEAAIDELATLQAAAATFDSAYDWAFQVAIQRAAAQAWLAHAIGQRDRAVELAAKAASMEARTEKNPVTPGEVLPARELYADLLLELGRHDEAREQYGTALERSPNRLRSLYGAGRAAELAGDAAAAVAYYRDLVAQCPDPTGEWPELEHARERIE